MMPLIIPADVGGEQVNAKSQEPHSPQELIIPADVGELISLQHQSKTYQHGRQQKTFYRQR